MRVLRRLLGRASLLLLLGAALYLYAAHQAGRAELRALCEQGVEPKVYRRVSADGYFDGGISCLRKGCWDVLTKSAFRYIEVEQRDAHPWDALSENGYYRLSKVRQESGLCDVKILEEMKRATRFKEFVKEGDCVRLEKLYEPTAKYAVASETVRVIDIPNLFGSKIIVRRMFIEEAGNENPVAERFNYVLFGNSLPVFSSFASAIGCPDVGVPSKLPSIGNVEFYIHAE